LHEVGQLAAKEGAKLGFAGLASDDQGNGLAEPVVGNAERDRFGDGPAVRSGSFQ